MRLVATLASLGLAAAVTSCQNTVCLNANYVNNVLYLNATAPQSIGWFGIGIGDQMANAQMFVFMRNSSGATLVSSRTAPSEVMPTVDSLDYTLDMAGSSGDFNASISCPGCAKHITTASAQPFIYSMYTTAMTFTTASANFPKHSVHGNLMLDVTNNTLRDSAASVVAAPQTSSSSSSSDGSSASMAMNTRLTIAHGTLMATSFIFLFPIGAIFLRFLSLRAHYVMQLCNICVVVAGFGIAVYISKGSQLGTPHQIIGLVVFILIWVQAAAGVIHHLHYKRKGVRGFYHRYLGRAVILLGISNGYVGIRLNTPNTATWPTAVYWTVVGVMLLVYGGIMLYLKMRGRNNKRTDQSPPVTERGSAKA